MQTEFPFTLPMGYVDNSGVSHREGVMRLATANDEIAPMKDPRVHRNQGYLAVILLTRVVTRLGTLPQISTAVMENLFAADFAFLEDLYRRINANGHDRLAVTCPGCATKFEVEVAESGES
jgi:hypothetical protein